MSRASTTGTIVVTFDQPILATSISAQSVVLTINGQTATINRAATIGGNTLTVDPTRCTTSGIARGVARVDTSEPVVTTGTGGYDDLPGHVGLRWGSDPRAADDALTGNTGVGPSTFTTR